MTSSETTRINVIKSQGTSRFNVTRNNELWRQVNWRMITSQETTCFNVIKSQETLRFNVTRKPFSKPTTKIVVAHFYNLWMGLWLSIVLSFEIDSKKTWFDFRQTCRFYKTFLTEYEQFNLDSWEFCVTRLADFLPFGRFLKPAVTMFAFAQIFGFFYRNIPGQEEMIVNKLIYYGLQNPVS